jgi:peptidoglycan/xylan/chitin deacetylase (PgdA/CDA1 family)
MLSSQLLADRSVHLLGQAKFALTFDDGPGRATMKILDCLAEFEVKATFFVLASNLDEAAWCGGDVKHSRSTVLRAVREDHVIGNHSYSHMSAHEAKRDLELFRRDVLRGQASIRGLLDEGGFPDAVPIPFRLPYGPQVEWRRPLLWGRPRRVPDPRGRVLEQLGLRHVHWSADPCDYKPGPSARDLAETLACHVQECAHRGTAAVILLHDGVPPFEADMPGSDRQLTVDTVRALLEICRREGWHSFTVPNADFG